LEDVKKQAPHADCQVTSTNVSRNLTLNRDKPPFDNADLRRAVALSLDPEPLSIFSNRIRVISARPCCRHPRDCGDTTGNAGDVARL
jgi:hypothetical protein